jgi:molecular chaperone GrpE
VPAPPPSSDEARAQLRRALDDVEASKRRIERDAARAEESLRGRLVTDLLPVLDNLDRTIDAGSSDEALLSGVKLVRAQLESVLATYGLERIVAVGAPFDPAEHEAVAVAAVTSAAEDGVITDELSRGYRLGGRVIVPARVRVGKLAK